jgi:RNA polymerase sigma-70 factor (ECF subfamily)
LYVTKEECDRYDDRELILRSQKEVEYFACIYNRYEARLIMYIRRLGALSREEAEDVLQDAFIKVWKSLGLYDTKMEFSNWLFRILHNQAISYLRKRNTNSRNYEKEYDETKYADIADDNQESMQHFLAIESDIYPILDRMILKHKEVLVLKFLENMSYEEISDILKIPEGTVATRINRAKKEFRKLVMDSPLSSQTNSLL